ncbi:hypothetical protein [Maribacter halichondriae]|uniref:hypothetical protein n=1 Tax=Maribacter halichondriae TaxID=2980554 RepID=UPI00235972DD|nr:hypothetical protein [Maribacter sp. Hal144]
MQRSIYIYFAAISLLGLWSCGDATNKTVEAGVGEAEATNELIQVTQEQFDNSGMLLGGLAEKSFPILVQTNGMIDVPPENRAVVNATMGGYIKGLRF